MWPMRLRELNVGCFGGGTGLPSLLGGLKRNPWLHLNGVVTMFDSGGSSGQLRDELGVLPPGDILKCALALARNTREARRILLGAAADARARAARRPHRRQPAAVDDAAVQRRFPQCGRRAAVAARVPGPRLAGQRGAGVGLRGVRRRIRDARRSGSGRGTDVRRAGAPHLARAAGVDSPDGRASDRRIRRRHHRAGQLLHQPDAHLSGGRRSRSAGAGERPGDSRRQSAHRRARHARLHRRRCGRSDRAGDPAQRGRRHHEHEVAVARKCSAATRSSTRSRSRPAICRRTCSWWRGISGRARSRGTIARRLAYAVWSVLSDRLLAD